jgi:hypothetical protein
MHGPLNAKWTYYFNIKSMSLTVAHTTEYGPVSEANSFNCSFTVHFERFKAFLSTNALFIKI